MKTQNFLLKFALTIGLFGKLNAAHLPDTLSPLSPPTPRIKLTVKIDFIFINTFNSDMP